MLRPIRPLTVLSFLTVIAAATRLSSAANPPDTLSLHPDNPRYFQWRGRPLVIIGSGEHYGAVLNPDFNFRTYLATLANDRLNHTRLFTGAAYVEPQGAFNITLNTLAPAGDRYLAPWSRSSEPGYHGGGNRFDLERWNPAYFQRLRDFVAEAGRREIIVEVNLFCPFYGEEQWRLSPFHPANNINGAGQGVARTNVYTLDGHGGLLTYQERFVRRVVAELREFDNLYYEICNEPYFGGVTLEWQALVASWIADAQGAHPDPKLISQNIANNHARVDQRLTHVDVYNFHYAAPPDAVALNWHLNRPIGDNETGFRGTNDAPYRMEAWDFMIAGGALFSHLDYSFAVGHEDGNFAYPASQPGGGNPALRASFRALRILLESLDFIRMAPQPAYIAGGVPPSHTARALVEPGRSAAIYLRPAMVSQFSVRWTGQLVASEAGEYELHARSNDGMRVWVGDRMVIDRWVDQSETEHSAKVSLPAGPHPLRVEYFYNGGEAAAKLAWTRPDGTREVIPPSALRPPDGAAEGLQAEYFRGRSLDQPWTRRVDRNLDFAWGTRSPFASPERRDPVRLQLNTMPGRWRAEWIEPQTGNVLREERLRHDQGLLTVEAPSFTEDIALRLTRR